MTPTEAKKLKVGTTVIWESTGEKGKVVEKWQAGIRVQWDGGSDAIYLYTQTSHVLRLRVG